MIAAQVLPVDARPIRRLARTVKVATRTARNPSSIRPSATAVLPGVSLF